VGQINITFGTMSIVVIFLDDFLHAFPISNEKRPGKVVEIVHLDFFYGSIN
jgi:hypothetical protein